jgi:hypothetical protein
MSATAGLVDRVSGAPVVFPDHLDDLRERM